MPAPCSRRVEEWKGSWEKDRDKAGLTLRRDRGRAAVPRLLPMIYPLPWFTVDQQTRWVPSPVTNHKGLGGPVAGNPI